MRLLLALPVQLARGRWVLLLLSGLMASCVEPYAPEIISTPPSLLVVDGFINADGPTTIRLTRTAALDAKATPPPETQAQVSVEAEDAGTTLALRETAPGQYVSLPAQLVPDRRYRLRITTQKGRQYASAYVPVKRTPPIDELRWTPENNAVSVLVSTHDDTRASQYYRWQFDETWEIRPIYQPTIEYYTVRVNVGGIRSIEVPLPAICWGANSSNRIILSQTTDLSQDIVSDFRVWLLPFDEPKLFSRYSILVRQQALTKKEFDYWQQLRKNTESIGTLFDPQPTQITGNVVCLDDPAQLALGFVGAHSVAEKRLFITRLELPRNSPLTSGYEQCVPPDSIRGTDTRTITQYFSRPDYLPIDYIQAKKGGVIGYTGKARDCVDCRTRGSAVRPSFW